MNSELKPYICPQCGGKVNPATMTCEYCGTKFKDIDQPRLVIEQPGVHVLQTSRIIYKEALEHYNADAETISKIVLDDMARQMAHLIYPFIEVTISEDVPQNALNMRGRLRVVDKNRRF